MHSTGNRPRSLVNFLAFFCRVPAFDVLSETSISWAGLCESDRPLPVTSLIAITFSRLTLSLRPSPPAPSFLRRECNYSSSNYAAKDVCLSVSVFMSALISPRVSIIYERGSGTRVQLCSDKVDVAFQYGLKIHCSGCPEVRQARPELRFNYGRCGKNLDTIIKISIPWCSLLIWSKVLFK